MTNPTATLETSLGTIQVELFVDEMPKTAGNFITLARSGFYDGLHFHRVIKGFMLQFGCPHSKDPSSPRAGTGNGPEGYIADNAYLDWFSPGNSKHPVFGKVTSGMDVVKKIETTPTSSGDQPRTPVKMIKVTVAE